MQNNAFIAFISELVQRLFVKSPKFFVIIQWISATVTAVSGIPEFLKTFNIVLPSPWNMFENKIVAISASVAFFISLLPAQTTPVSKDSTGLPLKKTDPTKMPFTAKDELNHTKS